MDQNDTVLLSAMEEACLAVGRYLLSPVAYEHIREVWKKPDNSIATRVDIESQKIIVGILQQKSTDPILAEENPASHYLVDSTEPFFLVDPIDGTTACRRFLGTSGGQVGFGPLIGYVKKRRLLGGTFFHVPSQTLFSAWKGQGVFSLRFEDLVKEGKLVPLHDRTALAIKKFPALDECAALFYTGEVVGASFVSQLRNKGIVESAYRFGGFANDCMRLTLGLEQIFIQMRVKPWDFTAAIFPYEAGLKVMSDPIGTAKDLGDWDIAAVNPVLIAPPSYFAKLLQELVEAGKSQ